jgi:hypothetical protein
MSDTIKGSDGIERTIDEWHQFFFERMTLADGDDPMAIRLGHTQATLLMELLDDDKDHTEEFGRVAGEYMALALQDAVENSSSESGKIERLRTHIEKLGRAISNFGWKKGQSFTLGSMLIKYVQEKQSLPTSRKELYQFIKDNGVDDLPNRTVDEYLSWYKVEKICATYHRD